MIIVPSALERPELHQGARALPEPGARRHVFPAPGPAAIQERPRRSTPTRRLGHDRHPQVRHLSAAGAAQRARRGQVRASPTSTTSTCTTRRGRACSTQASRAFSHGCMRVRNPLELAEMLLAEDKGWQPQQVADEVASGVENTEVCSPARSRCTSPTSRPGSTTRERSRPRRTSTGTRSASRWRSRASGAASPRGRTTSRR